LTLDKKVKLCYTELVRTVAKGNDMQCKVLDGTIGGAIGEIAIDDVIDWAFGDRVTVIVTESMVATGTFDLASNDIQIAIAANAKRIAQEIITLRDRCATAESEKDRRSINIQRDQRDADLLSEMKRIRRAVKDGNL
jgi:hypothetical protein